MELKNIFKMVKANRYTQDGREEIAKLQETEDVRYKTGDISQKTGLQKQPDGSWAPPKKGGAGAKKAAESKKIDYQVTEKGGKFYATGHQFSDGSQLHAGPFGSEKELHEFMNGSPYKSTAESKPAEKLPEAKFDEYGLPDDETIAMKDLFLQKENVADPNKLTNAEFNALAKKLDSELGIGNMELAQELLVTPRENPDYPFKPKTSEERAERAKFEKDRDDFIERMNAYREESSQWTNRAKGERTATLVDWLDDWDEHPEEKSEAGYAAIEKELASRGVTRQNRGSAKEADNKGRNEFYRRAYEGDAAPKIRELTGDCKIKIRPETQDKVYQIGEISQKTGLQKTANGWVKPRVNFTEKDIERHSPESRSAMIERQKMRESKAFKEKNAQIEKEHPRTETGAPAQKDPKEIIATPGKLATQEQTDAATAIADKNSYSFESMMEKFPIQRIQQFANSKVDDFEGGIDKYIEFKAEGRTGVDMEEVGKDFAKLINHNVARRIWNGYTNGSLKLDKNGFFKPAASMDSAPRVLTGDTKIRVKK